jgi:hypothetical protein
MKNSHLACPDLAMAQETGKEPLQMTFSSTDLNEDGGLAIGEAAKTDSTIFASTDAGNRRHISQPEARPTPPSGVSNLPAPSGVDPVKSSMKNRDTPRHFSLTSDEFTLERQILAGEVAEALHALLGNADTAEGVLDRYFELRASYEMAFWREVITALAQMRG